MIEETLVAVGGEVGVGVRTGTDERVMSYVGRVSDGWRKIRIKDTGVTHEVSGEPRRTRIRFSLLAFTAVSVRPLNYLYCVVPYHP